MAQIRLTDSITKALLQVGADEKRSASKKRGYGLIHDAMALDETEAGFRHGLGFHTTASTGSAKFVR